MTTEQINTEALLKRTDMAIKSTGKVPASLAKQLASDKGLTSRLDELLTKAEKEMGEDEINRIMNLSDEEFQKEYDELQKEIDDILNDPLDEFI